MARFTITEIDEVKGHVTFNILMAGEVVHTETRGDLPIEDKEATVAELERYTLDIVAARKAARKADKELTKIVAKPQEVVEPVVEPAEV